MSGRLNITVYMEKGTVTSDTQWMTAIQLSYGIPGILLMSLCFFVISIGKRYRKSSFYNLVLFDLFTNFLVYLNTWISIRIEMFPNLIFILKFIEYWIPGLLTLLKYLTYWFFHMHFYTAALLTIHRLSSITLPHQYEKMWNRYFAVVILLACVFSHLPKALWEGSLHEVHIIDGQLILMHFPESIKQARNVLASFSIVYLVINLSIGMLTAALASKNIETITLSKSNIKKKLTRISLTYTGAYVAEVSWSVISSANTYFDFMPSWWASVANNMLVFASDAFTLSLPCILLVFDANIQKDLRLKKSIASETVVVASATS